MYKVYLIANIENKKQYVGITKFSIEERFLQHTKRGFLLTEAIEKYGEQNTKCPRRCPKVQRTACSPSNWRLRLTIFETYTFLRK